MGALRAVRLVSLLLTAAAPRRECAKLLVLPLLVAAARVHAAVIIGLSPRNVMAGVHPAAWLGPCSRWPSTTVVLSERCTYAFSAWFLSCAYPCP